MALTLALPAAAQAGGLAGRRRAAGRAARARHVRGHRRRLLGPQTTSGRALRFQQRAGLVPDGIAGPRTRRALGRLGGPTLGSRDPAARLGRRRRGRAPVRARVARRPVRRVRRPLRLAPRCSRPPFSACAPACRSTASPGRGTLAALRRAGVRGGRLARPRRGPVDSGFGPRERPFHDGRRHRRRQRARRSAAAAAGTGHLRRLARGRLGLARRRRARPRRSDALRAPVERHRRLGARVGTAPSSGVGSTGHATGRTCTSRCASRARGRPAAAPRR